MFFNADEQVQERVESVAYPEDFYWGGQDGNIDRAASVGWRYWENLYERHMKCVNDIALHPHLNICTVKILFKN